MLLTHLHSHNKYSLKEKLRTQVNNYVCPSTDCYGTVVYAEADGINTSWTKLNCLLKWLFLPTIKLFEMV